MEFNNQNLYIVYFENIEQTFYLKRAFHVIKYEVHVYVSIGKKIILTYFITCAAAISVR